jgi:hypothetical protein
MPLKLVHESDLCYYSKDLVKSSNSVVIDPKMKGFIRQHASLYKCYYYTIGELFYGCYNHAIFISLEGWEAGYDDCYRVYEEWIVFYDDAKYIDDIIAEAYERIKYSDFDKIAAIRTYNELLDKEKT